jgi:epoxyqueuosine reductase QueG
MSGVLKDILGFLPSLNVSKWGVCDISGLHPVSAEYPAAVSLAMKYPEIPAVYSELVLHETILDAKGMLSQELLKVEKKLSCLNVKYLTVPEGQDPDTLLGYFPHKTAAVQAGLGWIGKNSLLITEEYGPRIRLATVLLDIKLDEDLILLEKEYAGLQTNRQISKCGDCTICAEACPYGCITGEHWHMGVKREVMLDAFRCSSTREQFIAKIGHKHTCGCCLLACPFGKHSK